MTIDLEDHPLLRVVVFITRFTAPLGDLTTPAGVSSLSAIDADAPLRREESLRAAIRDMLRWGGYKPTGRGKPASEYLVRAAEEGALGSINLAVDVCNVVSLHSGLPISVVDLALVRPPFRIGIPPAGASYVFNPAGQEIALDGLVCLSDADGPCANAVRDSQRTKTTPATRETLSIVWGVEGQEERLHAAEAWYRTLLAESGAVTEPVTGH